MRRREQGSAVVEFVFLAVVMIIPLIYLVLMLGRLQAASYAVVAAARESTRAYVTSPDGGSAPARAEAASRIAFADQGFDDGTVEITCSASPCLTPEGVVTSRASVDVPLPLVPEFVRGVVPLSVPISSTARASVDRFRSGP